MAKKLLALVIIAAFVYSTAAQTATQPTAQKPDEAAAKLAKEAVEFLRETSVEVGRLRTAENRISFNAELASLMWFHDDKEARAMYGNVINDFKQLLSQLDAQMNMPVVDDDDASSFSLFGGPGGYGKSKAERKLRIAMAVRQQIAMSLAEHAPDLAYNFYYDSINLITNVAFRKDTEQSDKNFESRLLTQIAESDAAKAVDYGKESIKRGLNNNHIELLKKIYAKDADKGIEFGSAILNRLKSDGSSVNNLYFYNSLLSFGAANFEASKKAGAKKPVYERNDMRDIADQFAQKILDGPTGLDPYSAVSWAEQIEKYAPGRGAQIRSKFKDIKNGKVLNNYSNMASAANAIAYPYGRSDMSSNSNSAANRANDERENREKVEKKMMDDIKDLGTKPLPKEERDFF